MSESLNGYVSLITGGSSGLGFEMAKQLLSQGASVIIAARGGKKLDNAKEMLSAFGDVHAVAMDVTDEGSVSTAADWVNTNLIIWIWWYAMQGSEGMHREWKQSLINISSSISPYLLSRLLSILILSVTLLLPGSSYR